MDRAGTAARVGLVGCGRWGALILRDLLSLGCEVSVVANSAATESRARSVGACQLVATIAELGPVDGVVVATPISSHMDVIDELLPLGVPLFVEKPLSTEPHGPRRLAATASDRVFVMHKWRYHPGVRVLADLAHREALGTVEGLRLVRTAWEITHGDADAVWVLAPHDLSIVLEILGAIPAPRWAFGRYRSGRWAHLVGMLGERPWVQLEVGSGTPRSERRIELFGSEGVAVLAGAYEEEVVVFRGGDCAAPIEERLDAKGEMPLLAELRTFVAHLRGGPAPASSLADEVAITDAIIGLRELAGFP